MGIRQLGLPTCQLPEIVLQDFEELRKRPSHRDQIILRQRGTQSGLQDRIRFCLKNVIRAHTIAGAGKQFHKKPAHSM